jgi:hypothetical protein
MGGISVWGNAMLCYVVWGKPNVLKGNIISTFRVKEDAKQEINRVQLAACFCWFLAGLLFYSEDGGDMSLQNALLSLAHTALQPKTLCSSR